MLRIAVQAKGRLYDETMSFLGESDIKLSAMKRSLLVQSSNFPLEVLFLRDDDIPQSVATGVADIGIVGENEFVEKNEDGTNTPGGSGGGGGADDKTDAEKFAESLVKDKGSDAESAEDIIGNYK